MAEANEPAGNESPELSKGNLSKLPLRKWLSILALLLSMFLVSLQKLLAPGGISNISTDLLRSGMGSCTPFHVPPLIFNTHKTIISTAIPKITSQFHSLNDVGWYGSAFFLTICVFQTIWGKLYRYTPIHYAFISAIIIFELGTLGCG